jgi:hypothetical protein
LADSRLAPLDLGELLDAVANDLEIAIGNH